MFERTNTADACGTSLQGYISIAPATLVKLFGTPDTCDEYKVSGEYVFKDDKGRVFTLYDWKDTTLYDRECVTPEERWASTNAYNFHIGATSNHIASIAEEALYELLLGNTESSLLKLAQ